MLASSQTYNPTLVDGDGVTHSVWCVTKDLLDAWSIDSSVFGSGDDYVAFFISPLFLDSSTPPVQDVVSEQDTTWEVGFGVSGVNFTSSYDTTKDTYSFVGADWAYPNRTDVPDESTGFDWSNLNATERGGVSSSNGSGYPLGSEAPQKFYTNSWGVGGEGDAEGGDANLLRVNDIYVADTQYGVGGNWSTQGSSSSAISALGTFYSQGWYKLLRASQDVEFGKAVFTTVESGSQSLFYFKLTFKDTKNVPNIDSIDTCVSGTEIAKEIQSWYSNFMTNVVETYGYDKAKYLVLEIVNNPEDAKNVCIAE